MDVVVKYPKPSFKTKVTCKSGDLAGVFEELNAAGDWGKFDPDYWYEYDDEGGTVTEARILAKPVIYMPKWGSYSSAAKEEKKEWDRMIKALDVHEDQHYMLFQYKVEKFRKELLKKYGEKKPLSVKKFKDEYKKFDKEHSTLQKNHDKSTKHGEKDGVYLTF